MKLYREQCRLYIEGANRRAKQLREQGAGGKETYVESEEDAENMAKKHWLIAGEHKKWQDMDVEKILQAVVEGEAFSESEQSPMDVDEDEEEEIGMEQEE